MASPYYIRFVNPAVNFVGRSIKYIMSGTIGMGNTGVQGGTATDWYGSGGASNKAELKFEYMFDGNADIEMAYTILGELDLGPTAAPLQTIQMNVPTVELQRMLVYTTGWVNGQTGIGGGTRGLTGEQPSPIVGLILKDVLSNLNVTSGITGRGGVLNKVDRLAGYDRLFTTLTPGQPQNGVTGTVPWPFLYPGSTGSLAGGPTGGSTGILGYSRASNGYFKDDAGVITAQLGTSVYDPSTPNPGVYTYSAGSVLNSIPVEAIRDVTRGTSRNLPKLGGATGIFGNLDSTNGKYADPLRNLFEQAVAFGRADDTIPVSLSAVPAGFGYPGAWQTGRVIYGVDFQVNDTLSLYIKYSIGERRVYGIDPTVMTNLPGFTNGPVYELTYNGKTFNIPVGAKDTNSTVYTNYYNMDTAQAIADEKSTNGTNFIVELRLVATPLSTKSVFDY